VLARLDQAPPSLRIGLCADAGAEFPIAVANSDAVRHAGAVLRAAGHDVVEIRSQRLLPLARDASIVFDRIISVNLARNLGADLSRVEPLTAAAARRGHAITAVELQAADLLMVGIAHAMWLLFAEIDVLITPMLSGPPLPIGSFPLAHEDVELHWRRMAAFAPFATIANAAGTPALSIPHGAADGLPLSVQLVGPLATDGLLLRLARQLQLAEPWSFQASVAGLPG
jgi:amidase